MASLRSARIHSLKVKCLGAVRLRFSHLRSARIALDHEQVQITNTNTETVHTKMMFIHPGQTHMALFLQATQKEMQDELRKSLSCHFMC